MALDLKNYIPALKMGASITIDGSQIVTTDFTCNGNTVLGNASGDTTAVTGATTITSAGASALAVGRLGATTPGLVVDASTATSVTGLKIKTAGAAGGLAVSTVSSGTDESLTIDAKGTGTVTINGTATGIVVLPAGTTIGGSAVAALGVITSNSATALAVGRLGATTPAFTVDSSTGSQVAGLKVTGAATGGTVAVVATDSGADASVTVNAKGAGTIGIGTVSTGAVTITPATTITGALTLTAGTTGKVINTGTETIAAAGTTTALDLTKFHHDIDADGGGDIFTLANGTAGQQTLIVLKTATGVATITPQTFLGGTSITLNAAGDSVHLYYGALGWQIMGGNSYAIV